MSLDTLKLGFDAASDYGKLWADIEESRCGRSEEKEKCIADLRNQAHTGCTDSFDLIPIQTFYPDKLAECEVLEQAYRFSEFHASLVKHGFAPPPYVLDDLNPETTVDSDVQKEVYDAVDKMQLQLMQKGLNPDSEEFRYEMSKCIYDWGVVALDFDKDCELELPAWEAYAKKCGKCTEISTIIYAACKRAGLDPYLLEVNGLKIGLNEFFPAFQNEKGARGTGHQAVMVTISEERNVIIDVAYNSFDAKYPDTLKLTPRQYLHQWLNNLAGDLNRAGKGYEDNLKTCIKIAPNSIDCHLLANELSEASLESLQERFGSYQFFPLVKTTQDINRLLKGGTNAAFLPKDLEAKTSELVEQLSNIAKEYPKAASKFAYLYFGGRLLKGLDALNNLTVDVGIGFSNEELAKYFCRVFRMLPLNGIMWNKDFLPNHYAYLDMVQLIKGVDTNKEAFELFDGFSRQDPSYEIYRFEAIVMGLLYIKGLQGDEFNQTAKLIQQHIDYLADKHPEWPVFKSLNANLAMLRMDLKKAIAIEETLFNNDPSGMSEMDYVGLFEAYMFSGEKDKAINVARKGFDVHGDSLKKKVADELIRIMAASFAGGERKKAGLYEIKGNKTANDLFSLVETTARMISEDNKFKEEFDSMVLLLAGIYLLSLKNDKKWSALLNEVAKPLSPRAQKAVEALLKNLTKELYAPDTKITNEKLKRFIISSDVYSSLLKDVGKAAVARYNVALAKWSILLGNNKEALRLFQAAIDADRTAALLSYFEDVIKIIYTDASSHENDKKKLEIALSAMELCVETNPSCTKEMLEVIKNGSECFLDTPLKKRVEQLIYRIDKITNPDPIGTNP